MDESNYIDLCLTQVEETLGWRPHEEWTDGDFKKLGRYILEKTGISISAHTLKRLFGKVKYKSTYNPQEATKAALAKYLGYESWDDFVLQHKPEKEKDRKVQTSSDAGDVKSVNRPFSKKLLPYLLVFVFVLVIVIVVFASRGTTIWPAKAEFRIENPEGPVPHTVTFFYDVSNVRPGHGMIDYGFVHPYLGGEYVLVNKNEKVLNYTYQIPGVYRPELIIDNMVVDSGLVVAKSNGWVSFYQSEESRDLYWLTNMIENFNFQHYMTLSRENIIKYGGDTLGVYYTTHRNIRDFGITGDNYKLEARIMNGPQNGGITCFDANIRIICKNSDSYLRMVESNCQSYCQIRFGEKYFSGMNRDLSFLATNIARWNLVNIEVINKKARILINNNEVFSTEYDKDCGEILGLQFRFKGSGLVDYVNLRTVNDSLVYADSF